MKFVRQPFLLFISVMALFASGSKAGVYDPSTLSTVLPGKWRGVFHLRPGVEVPFNFEIRPSGKALEVYLVNGDEKFATGNLNISGDSAFIPLSLFDNELAFAVDGNRLTGVLRRVDKRGSGTLFEAAKGGNFRFIETGTLPVKDISGRYDVVFQQAGGKEEKAVGIFRQEGNRLQATFLRVTGDSRYLDGMIEGRDIALSSFIGSGPVYYKATVQEDGSIKGEIVTARGGQPFVAALNDKASLPDAYTLTRLKKETSSLQFSFPDAKGDLVSTADQRFAGKVLVVTIGGTWCPNCMDEAAFLAPWYEKNRSRGVEVVALQYERDTSRGNVKKVFDRFSRRYNLKYPLLLGGVADKKAVTASLPALDNFLSFPTTLFIDRKGQVRKIHTGFSGPATGAEYGKFIHEFNDTVNELLAEK
ncbi:TlpA disulfide reductase family protein [Sediminibacterium ginsengisoli]|uniref:Peroxiredoxin n=1 Tax=Sediminibacterium ginsengisoli TaxID=413434 RepID=A0A1T4R183_9BACT|nr:TlpA disulfide reductase family protein [Sediminibacterium ginsengisoli]SKA09647.1 Peroxiredoxin [Sediminibacterium ginsengisoli]